jgi:hypothetical protein
MADTTYVYPPSSASANASVGTTGATAPTSATEIAGVNPAGNLQPVAVDSNGNIGNQPFVDLKTTGSLTALNSTVQEAIHGLSEAGVLVGGTWVGTINMQGSVDGATWTNLSTFLSGSGGVWTSAGMTVNGDYKATGIAGYTQLRALMSAYTSGTATITINASATGSIINVKQPNPANLFATVTQGPGNTPSTTTPWNVQVGTTAGLAQTTPYAMTVSGYGAARVSPEANSIFYDPFDSAIDTTIRWVTPTSSGSGTVTQGAGGETIAGGTTASSYAKLTSQGGFVGFVPGYAQCGFAIQLEASPILNAHRFWGTATSPATPATTTPITDGVGWEITTAGKLFAVVYQSGTRIFAVDLSSSGTNKQPLDGAYHRYVTYVRTDKTFWYLDSLDVPLAVSNFNFPTIQTLPILFQTTNSATPPATSPTIVCTGVGIGDTGRSSTAIGDGLNPYIKANVTTALALKVDGSAVTQPVSQGTPAATANAWPTKVTDGTNVSAVKAASTAPTATDPALVVSLSPNSSALGSGGSAGVANAPVQNIYSTTSITTSAYTQLIAATTSATNYIDIFDSSGQAMILATGGSGSEVIQYYVPPGGDSIRLKIPAGTRVAYKALTATASAGYLLMNLLQ